MAKGKQQIDPERFYRVKLNGVLEVRPGVFARPGDDVVLKGAKLEAALAKAESWEPV